MKLGDWMVLGATTGTAYAMRANELTPTFAAIATASLWAAGLYVLLRIVNLLEKKS